MLNGLFVTSNFLIDGFKSLLFNLDRIIFSLVQAAYGVFEFLADATILDSNGRDIVGIFTNRVYTLLGIIMVFVLAFNLLNYIIDPDKINDKKIGATAFVKDVVIALAVISITPMLFTKLYSLQSEILDSGVIVNLILGGQTMGEGRDVGDTIDNGGNIMVASVYTAFLYPEDGKFSVLDCGTEKETAEYSNYCKAYKNVQEGKGLGEFSSFINNEKYNYSFLVSTAGGIVLLFFMLSFCLNLAKRVGKMAIVQLIAPIPVTLEILPNKKGLRKTWFNTLISTYLEVFFFLAVMYIIVFLISLVPDVIGAIFNGVTGEGITVTKLIATVILIYGLLMFGKEAPKMIFDLLGIKQTGVITEAMKRAINIAGSTTSGVGAGVTSLTRNGYNAFNNFKNASGTRGKAAAIGGGLAGMLTGTVGGVARGMYMNRSGGFKNIKKTTSQAINANLESQRRTVSNLRSYGESISNATGFKDTTKAIFDPAKKGVVDPIGKWAKGNNYGAMNAELQSYNHYKSLFDSTKIKPATDERYLSFQKELDKVFADNGINPNAFNAKKKAYLDAHTGSTLADYLSSGDFARDFGTAGAYASGDIARLSGAMDSREDAMKAAKKNDLIIAVAQAKALVESNSDVAAIARDAGIDVKSISISATSSETDLISAYNTLKNLNSKVDDKMTKIRTDIAAQEMRDKQKQNGGGSGNNK